MMVSFFTYRMERIVDDDRELPKDFLTELYKWALECKCYSSCCCFATLSLCIFPLQDLRGRFYIIKFSFSAVGAWALGTRLGCFRDNDTDAKEIIRCIHGFFHSVPELELSAPLWRLYSTPAYKTYVEALDAFRTLCLQRLTDNGVCAQIAKNSGEKVAAILALDLMLVGVDTTAAAAASTMYLLANNNRVQRSLQRELNKHLPINRTMTSKDLEKLPYLKACIKESLR